jgi:tRNA-splicing ligase RtcB
MGKIVKFDKPFNEISRVDWLELLNVPIKLWLSEIETGALDQYYNLARLPFVFKHIAAMPDSHLGYGMPIGGVMATRGYVVPNAVGVDIGCGMLCVQTDLTKIDKRILKKIMSDIRKLIPVGFNRHKNPQDNRHMPTWNQTIHPTVVENEYDSARTQLGTLGGGNHFIEVQKGDDGYIYVMIHSGSRNLGKQVADHYNKYAIEKNKEWSSPVPKNWQLAFLPLLHSMGQAYMSDMNYCVRFAFQNRYLMMERVIEAFTNHIDVTFYMGGHINIAHNYAKMEHHFGKNVLVHRKGATSAFNDELGIIPGSQGMTSYIVRGKGNPESFMSCSHGSGRVMGRKQAQKTLDLEEEKKKLDDQGIIHSIRGKKDLDEASGAYKNIYDVMAHQTDLIAIVRELQPLAVIKG